MPVTYKDIGDLSEKSTVAGTEKLPVSDTEYITPNQIAGLVSVPTVDSTVNINSTNTLQNKVIATTFLRGKAMTPTSVVDGKFLQRDGTEYSTGSYHYSLYEVNAGEHYAVTAYFSSSYTTGMIRLVVWLNDNNVVVGYTTEGNKSGSSVSYYDVIVVVPTGATKAAVNCYKTSSIQSFKYVAPPSPDCERNTNKVTSISSASTDAEYPSAKCVYDGLSGKQKSITISSAEPTSGDGSDGDIWIVV